MLCDLRDENRRIAFNTVDQLIRVASLYNCPIWVNSTASSLAQTIMKDFPTELILEVLQYTSIGTRLAFRCTCRSYCSLASPVAFRAVHVTNSVESMNGLQNLECSEELRTLVREVVFCYMPTSTQFRGSDQVDAGGWIDDHDGIWMSSELKVICNSIKAAFKNLIQFPFLHTLRLDFGTRQTLLYENLDGNHDENDILNAIFQGALIEPSRLKLNLIEMTKLIARKSNEVYVENILSSLTSLSLIAVLWDGDPDLNTSHLYEAIDRLFYGDTVPRIYLHPARTNLSSLTLHGDVYLTALIDLGCHFVRLTFLSLSRITFCYFIPALPPYQVETFIIRHKATLEHLELHDCPIVLPPSTRTRTSGESTIASRVWSLVWNRFETELSCLRDFELARRSLSEDNMLTVDYVNSDRLQVVCSQEQLDDDKEALERFRSTVRSRKADIVKFS